MQQTNISTIIFVLVEHYLILGCSWWKDITCGYKTVGGVLAIWKPCTIVATAELQCKLFEVGNSPFAWVRMAAGEFKCATI